jgi:phosphoribosyl 1,2-cyclic phosphodiesterase
MSVTITFWGTRGTIPTPGAQTVRHGGNTSCVAVEDARGHLLILDAGTGIRGLGRQLAGDAGPDGVAADIVLSHAHWDHIQGLPYFAPFFRAGNRLTVWGPRQGDQGLDTILRQQMQPAVFPVPLEALAASLEVRHVETEPFDPPGFRVRPFRLRHPSVTLGYRVETESGPALAYVTDNELGPGGSYDVGKRWRERLVGFLTGAEVLIHDAMYTDEQVAVRRGWGHSTYGEAVSLAAEAGAARLLLFHHEPEHGDEALDGITAAARVMAAACGSNLVVDAAAEGMSVSLEARKR